MRRWHRMQYKSSVLISMWVMVYGAEDLAEDRWRTFKELLIVDWVLKYRWCTSGRGRVYHEPMIPTARVRKMMIETNGAEIQANGLVPNYLEARTVQIVSCRRKPQ